MKKPFLFLVALICCCFLSSCFDMEEAYVLNADGSYTLEYSMDMGKVFSELSEMMSDSAKQTAKYTARKDSLISFTDNMADTIRKKISEKEYNMLKQSQMRITMYLPDNLFKISYLNSGKNLEDINFFIKNFNAIIKKTGKEKDLVDELSGSAGKLRPEQRNQSNDVAGYDNTGFSVVVTPTTFSKHVIPEKWKVKLEEDREIHDNMRNLGLSMSYTTTIRFPRPVRKVDNPEVKLSADRMQITYTVDLIKSIQNPDIMNFKVDY